MRRALVLSTLILAACKTAGHAPSPQESLLDAIHHDAVGALVVRGNAFRLLRQRIDEDPATQKELSEYLVRRIGIDLSQVSAMVVFTTAPDAKDGAVFLRIPGKGPLGTPTWPKVGEVDGTALYKLEDSFFAAVVPRGVVMGSDAGVRAAVAVAYNKQPPLQKGSPLEALLDIDPTTSFATAATVGAVSDPSAAQVAQVYGLSSVVAGYSPAKVYVWGTGDPARLTTARDTLDNLIKLGLGKMRDQKAKALAGDSTLTGALAIVSTSQTEHLAAKLAPRMENGRLVIDFSLASGDGQMVMMTTVAVTGILAAIAIPSFMKYIRRSKNTEATMNLRNIYSSEVAYREMHGAFTGSTDWTPTSPCCSGPDKKCVGTSSPFTGPVWEALNFSIGDPFRFQYRVRTTKTGFTVEARGDLDCNGKVSTFQRAGVLQPDGTVKGDALQESE
jgi:type II secretory pathway pseudopilin PulG